MSKVPCAGVWAPTELSYFTMATSAILLVITVCGNLLVCVAVIKDPYKKLRTPFMFILVNLAITDLIVGSVTLPTSVTTHYFEAEKTKKKFHVVIIHMTYFISCTASVFNLTALCIDRFCAVQWPVKYRYWLTFRVCTLISTSIWMLALSVTMLYWAIGYINFLFIYAQAALVIAILISSVTYGISRKLRKQAENRRTSFGSMILKETDQVNSLPSLMQNVSTKAERNVTRVLLTILIMFILCYTPSIIMMYILKFCPHCDCVLRHVLRDMTFLCICTNSAVNPFVCTIRLKSFRDALSVIFLNKKAIRRRASTATSQMSFSIRKSTLVATDSVSPPSSPGVTKDFNYSLNENAVIRQITVSPGRRSCPSSPDILQNISFHFNHKQGFERTLLKSTWS